MKTNRVLWLIAVIFSAQSAFATDKEEAMRRWKSADETIIKAFELNKNRDPRLVKNKDELTLPTYAEKFGWGGNTYVCYDVNGNEISKDECDDALKFVSSLNGRMVESIKARWEKDKCRTRLDEGFCKSDYQGLKGTNAQLNKFLEENRVIALKTVPTSFQKYKSLVEENLAQLEPIEQKLSNPQDMVKIVKQKLNSRECKVFHVTADICRKAYIEASADKGLAVEDEATKQSGATNLYSRYKLGQMKALHGTANLPQLKKQYRELIGSEWTPKACEADPDRKTASSVTSDENEELEACGCSGLDCQDIK